MSDSITLWMHILVINNNINEKKNIHCNFNRYKVLGLSERKLYISMKVCWLFETGSGSNLASQSV